MYHNATHHYLFWGPGSVNVAVSSDYINWQTLNSSAVFGRENWLTGGPPSDPGRRGVLAKMLAKGPGRRGMLPQMLPTVRLVFFGNTEHQKYPET